MSVDQKPMDLTEKNIDGILKKYPLLVVEFRTSVCSPCTVLERGSMESMIQEIERKHPGRFFFGRIVIDKNPALARRFDVRSSMTFLVFKDGEIVDRIAGLQAKNVLESVRETLSRLG